MRARVGLMAEGTLRAAAPGAARAVAFSAFLLAACAAPAGQAVGESGAVPALAIVNARMLDDVQGGVQENVTILISGARISDVIPGGAAPPAAQVVDAAGQTVLPGFIDLHAHLLSGGFDTISGRSASFDPAAQRRALAQMLYWGVTSAAFSVQPLEAGITLRERLAAGEVAGPRLFVSGPGLTAPGGWAGTGDPQARIELATAAEARSAVRRLAGAGVDFLKAFYDDMATAFATPMPKMRRDVLEALIGEAHLHGLKVAVHAYTVANHKDALAAGADILYHSAIDRPVDDDYITLARRSGAAYAATLSIYWDTFDAAAIARLLQVDAVRAGVPAQTRASLGPDGPLRGFIAATRGADIVRLQPTIARNLQRLFETGTPVVVGPDTGVPGVFPGFSVHREMALMVQAGMPPPAVLAAATRQGAEALGQGARIGAIAPGRIADLVIVEGDPTHAITDTRRIRAVIQGGRIVDRDALHRISEQLQPQAVKDHDDTNS